MFQIIGGSCAVVFTSAAFMGLSSLSAERRAEMAPIRDGLREDIQTGETLVCFEPKEGIDPLIIETTGDSYLKRELDGLKARGLSSNSQGVTSRIKLVFKVAIEEEGLPQLAINCDQLQNISNPVIANGEVYTGIDSIPFFPNPYKVVGRIDFHGLKATPN